MKLDEKSGLITDAEYIASPNCDERPPGSRVDVVVIHCISLPPGVFNGTAIQEFFCGGLDADAHPYYQEIAGMRVSSHFLIRRDGQLMQFVPVCHRAWHAGASEFRGRNCVNDFSIGIELEGTDIDEFEDVQYDVLTALTKTLMGSFPGIAVERLVGHSDIAPGRKTDPGPGFDWARYRTACGQM